MVDRVREEDRAVLLLGDGLGDAVEPLLGENAEGGEPERVRVDAVRVSVRVSLGMDGGGGGDVGEELLQGPGGEGCGGVCEGCEEEVVRVKAEAKGAADEEQRDSGGA